jgi:hypothetical protein
MGRSQLRSDLSGKARVGACELRRSDRARTPENGTTGTVFCRAGFTGSSLERNPGHPISRQAKERRGMDGRLPVEVWVMSFLDEVLRFAGVFYKTS